MHARSCVCKRVCADRNLRWPSSVCWDISVWNKIFVWDAVRLVCEWESVLSVWMYSLKCTHISHINVAFCTNINNTMKMYYKCLTILLPYFATNNNDGLRYHYCCWWYCYHYYYNNNCAYHTLIWMYFFTERF